MAVLLRAYQALDVERTLAGKPWPHRRTRQRFIKLLRRACRRDALGRQLRVRYSLPTPRTEALENAAPGCVEHAIERLDPQVRESVRSLVQGHHERLSSGHTRLSAVFHRISTGMEEFRRHLINEALAAPSEIPTLHPQYLRYCESPLPQRLGHPLVGFVFVRLPVGAIVLLLSLFATLYFSTYAYLNWSMFNNGEFVAKQLSERLSDRIEGQMIFERVRFGPMLLVDALSGQPHRLELKGVSVFEPSATAGEAAPHLTAYAEDLTVDLNIREVIPLNWLNIPRFLLFPWILHFSHIESKGEFMVEAREIPGDPNGTVGLIAAFQVEPSNSLIPPWAKTLGIEVDHLKIANPKVRLLFEETSTWAIEIRAATIEGNLHYEGHRSDQGSPDLIPLRWTMRADDVDGEIRALGYKVPLKDVTIDKIADGADDIPLGDLAIDATGLFAGGPAKLSGVLRGLSDRAKPVTANAELSSNELGPLVDWFLREVLDATPTDRPMFAGEGARGRISIVGPLEDPVLTLEAEGLAASLFEEAEWDVTELGVRLDLSKDTVPTEWSATWAELSGQAELPERWMIRFDVLRGESIDGSLGLQGIGADDHVVLPSGADDPLLASLDFDVTDINPGKIFLDVPDLATPLQGRASGRLKVRELVLRPTKTDGLAFLRTRLKLDGLQVTRVRSPSDDGLPKRFRVDGEVNFEDPGGLDLKNLIIGLDGGSISGAVGLESDWTTFKPSSLNLDIRDGAAFFASVGLPAYVSALSWEMNFRGPLARIAGSEREMRFENLKLGNIELSDVTTGTATFRRGVFEFRAKNAELLGGKGPLDIDANFFKGDGFADVPTLKLRAELEGMDRENILGTGVDVTGAELSLKIDDGDGGQVPFSKLRARGFASANVVSTKAATFRDANLGFIFLENGLQIDTLSLEYHPPLSPYYGQPTSGIKGNGGSATIPYGRIEGNGQISFESVKPSVDLYLRASRIPLSSLSDLVFPELELRGNLSTKSSNSMLSDGSLTASTCVKDGDCLHVRGNLDSPEVVGSVYLNGFSALNIPLGSGRLEITPATVDDPSLPNDGQLTSAATQGLQVAATFETSAPSEDLEDPALAWSATAVVAFRSNGREAASMDAYLEAVAPRIPIAAFLPGAANKKFREAIVAEIGGARVNTSYCGSSTALINGCREQFGAGLLPSEISVDYAWAHPRLTASAPQPTKEESAPVSRPTPAGGNCSSERSLCSVTPLRARLDGDLLSLQESWMLATGGTSTEQMQIDGTFDLGEPPVISADNTCSARPRSVGANDPKAQLRGSVNLAGFAAELEPYGVLKPEGVLNLGLTLTGPVSSPLIFGTAMLESEAPIAFEIDSARFSDMTEAELDAAPTPIIPVIVDKLDFRFAGSKGESSVVLNVFDERVSLDTEFGVRAECSQEFSLRANGHLAGQTISALAPEFISQGSGRLALNELRVGGIMDAENGGRLVSMSGEFLFEPDTPLVLATPIDTIRLTNGTVRLDSCRDSANGTCTDRGSDASSPPLADRSKILPILSIGGLGASGATVAPSTSLVMSIGNQGSMALWGDLILSSSFDELNGATLRASLDRVPFTSTDNSGVPELELSLSSSNLTARMDEFKTLSLSGELFLERSRWLRDANLRASLISFADPTPAPPDRLPKILSETSLDLKVRTNAPFRTDINVLKGVEARGEIDIGGTVAEPLLSGEVTLDRGEVNIPILGEPYRIEQGSVRVEDDMSLSEVNLTAVGLEPKKIDNQLKTVKLVVRGPLNAITWECLTAGNTSGQLTTTRGCLDFVVFDAGNPELARADVRRAGGGSLVYARPLTLVGNLTQITVNDLIDDEAPVWEARLPIIRARVTQLGVEAKLDTRPEWFNLGWGQLSFGLNYLQGFPGGLLRNSRRLYGRLDLFGNTNLEFRTGRRNYSQRVLILDPSDYSALELGQTWELPSLR